MSAINQTDKDWYSIPKINIENVTALSQQQQHIVLKEEQLKHDDSNSDIEELDDDLELNNKLEPTISLSSLNSSTNHNNTNTIPTPPAGSASSSTSSLKPLSPLRINPTYELSNDLKQKELEILNHKYGGYLRARRAARTIQSAYRQYKLKKNYEKLFENNLRRRSIDVIMIQQDTTKLKMKNLDLPSVDFEQLVERIDNNNIGQINDSLSMYYQSLNDDLTVTTR